MERDREFRDPSADLRFGDFDGDGRTDVMVVEGGYWSISRGASSPWTPYAHKFLWNLSITVVGDFDGDGKADLAWQDGDAWRYSSRGCVAPAILLGSGASFLPPLLSFKVGDFDHGGADALLNYESHWDQKHKEVVFDSRFIAIQLGSNSWAFSRYEMR